MYLGVCFDCDSENLALRTVAEVQPIVEKYLAQQDEWYQQQCGKPYPISTNDIESVIICVDCERIENVIEFYKDEFRPENQTNIVEGFAINPRLRHHFDSLDNNLRPAQEKRDWFCRPFIRTEEYSPADESYEAFALRVEGLGGPVKESKSEWLERTGKQKAAWFESWPSGIRYDVRCYDNGAWDRSTNRGMYQTLEEAIEVCKEYTPPDYSKLNPLNTVSG